MPDHQVRIVDMFDYTLKRKNEIECEMSTLMLTDSLNKSKSKSKVGCYYCLFLLDRWLSPISNY